MTKTGEHLTALYQRVYELAFNLPPGGLSKPDFSKADAGEDLINQLLGSGQSTAGPRRSLARLSRLATKTSKNYWR